MHNLANSNITVLSKTMQPLKCYVVYTKTFLRQRKFLTSYVATTSPRPKFGFSVIHSVCTGFYCKSNRPTSWKFNGVIIGPAKRKNWLTFGDRSSPGYGFRITFPLSSLLRNREF